MLTDSVVSCEADLPALRRQSPNNHLRISSPAEFDRDVRSWLRESYRAGQQLHLLENKKAPVN